MQHTPRNATIAQSLASVQSYIEVRSRYYIEELVSDRGGLLRPIWRPRLDTNPSEWTNRKVGRDGYVTCSPPFTGLSRVSEHKLIMECRLGRRMKPGESIHHRNTIRDDNRPENLELWLVGTRPGGRASDITCPHCGKPYDSP